MASRVLYFWKPLNKSWRDKASYLRVRKLMGLYDSKFEKVKETLSLRKEENQLKANRKVKYVLIPFALS